MVNLANPTAFVELTRRVLPWLAAATAVLFAAGLWLSFAAACGLTMAAYRSYRRFAVLVQL